MEYCRGGPLAYKYLAELESLEKLRIFYAICQAVGFAHSAGVVHRDLKPENIFFRADRRTPVVGDFGLCLIASDEERLTETTEAVGGRCYMAPELEDGRNVDVDAKADVYSLGKLLYWMLAGRVFSREKHRQPEYDLTKDRPDDLCVTFTYEILEGMIVENPEGRKYSDGNAVVAAIAAVIRKLGTGANPVGIGLPQRCIYCGEGRCHPIYASYTEPGEMPLKSSHDLGIQLINERSRKWIFFACDTCGNVQVFRADRANDPDIWNRH